MRTAGVNEVDSKSTGLSHQLLREIVESVVRHAAARKVVLYGSRARGDFEATSDIDIAVECDEKKDFLRNVIDDEIRTLLKIEIVSMHEVNQQLRDEIEREGITLYEKV